MILTIDATVTGPDGTIMTGSTAVTVNEPPASTAREQADLTTLRMRQRAQALRGGMSRA